MLLIAVQPIAIRRHEALVHHADGTCGYEPFERPIPPQWAEEQGEQLRDVRVSGGFTPHTAARTMRLRPQDVSDLEAGRVTFSNDNDRRTYLAALGGR